MIAANDKNAATSQISVILPHKMKVFTHDRTTRALAVSKNMAIGSHERG